jgi:tyrosinase
LFENYPRPEDDDHILAIDGWFPFGSGPSDDHFFGALENVHNLLHLFTGGPNPNYNSTRYPNPQNRIEPQYGDMFSNSTTTFDPFFWSYHSNVDRMWDLWQQAHPGVNPDDPTAVLPPFNFTVADTLSVKKLGYEYQLGASVYETDPDTSITRFKSAKSPVHPHTLANFARAEVRLSGVRYSMAGGGVLRVFLNEPDANENTPTKGNDHYVGHFALFAGGCVGGPGHCAPPEAPRGKYDLRHRHPKTPGNIRIDATDTVTKLRAKGAKDFHIHVLALGPDGKPSGDVLRLASVSLNFFD